MRVARSLKAATYNIFQGCRELAPARSICHSCHSTYENESRRSLQLLTTILGGVRVVNDLLTIRAYGGAQAFDPDNFEAWSADPTNNIDPTVPQLPPGVTVEMAEQMVVELQKQTGMNLQYAKDCLEAAGWDFQKGLETFGNVKANLGPEAFA